ncbi:phage head closure protein [Paraburkholderia silviterrae]|uniref:Head-tail adaptor protein n=1 Tax=Paraburkholderia silviterrae TaxID=2528715 RepID=A0A4R5ME75_9BURK|nr:phage head closure protein [Paraburkholderia silviterrae]TDG25359.1 head-tail adaptor protein [Paraburkholderia silviterrae]
MRSGDFNRRITIQVKKEGEDELGQPLTEWINLAKDVPTNLLATNGKEYVASGEEVSKAQVSMRIRWRTDITAAMRVLYDGGIFNIEAVLPDYAGRRYVDLACSMGANNG